MSTASASRRQGCVIPTGDPAVVKPLPADTLSAATGGFPVRCPSMRVLIVVPWLWLGLLAPSSNAAEASAPASIGDGRTPITLTARERDYVLAGMREHVSQIQSIVDALAADDRHRAQAVALEAGSKHFLELTDHPPGLAGKWPESWKLLLRARLQSFDALAQGIQDGETTSESLKRLSTAMQTCTACHAAFRLASEHE